MENTRNNSLSADLIARTSGCLAQFVRSGDRLAAALSGGMDSVALLHILHKLSRAHGFNLHAVHVNHGISHNADRWQMFCEQLCATKGIPLVIKKIVVDRYSKGGLEEAARRERYMAFAETNAEWLLLAHHGDDQAETVLFNLLRGAGVVGAGAMPVMRQITHRSDIRILRPFLGIPREAVLAYARREHLEWIEDESNSDSKYARNFLRHKIFPLLRERFPGCGAVLARAAAHFAESDELLEDLARIDAEAAMPNGRIMVSQLAQLGDARARNLLRHVLRSEGLIQPDSVRLQEIVRQLCHAGSDRQLRFELGGKALHRYRGEVWLVTQNESEGDLVWRGEERLRWGAAALRFISLKGKGISREKLLGGRVRISHRRGGERFRPDVRKPRRELKKLLQEHAVPPWVRKWMPLLWCDSELVWVPGIGIDSAWQCSPEEFGILPKLEDLPQD